MKKFYFALLLILSGSAQAAFEYYDYSGRAVGFGDAFTAMADDVSAMYINPAGTAFINKKSISFSYSKPYSGVGDDLSNGYIAMAIPIDENVSAGIYYSGFGLDVYTEKTYAVTLGYKKILDNKQYLSFGVSVKNLVKALGFGDSIDANPVFAGNRSVSAFSFDAGAIYRMGSASFGLAIQNINQPDINFGTASDPVSMRITGGAAAKIMSGMIAEADYSVFGASWVASVGGEYNINKSNLCVRLGGGIGSDSYTRLNAGFGYDYTLPGSGVSVGIDYGFSYQLGFIDGSIGSHILTLTFRELPKKTGKEGEDAK